MLILVSCSRTVHADYDNDGWRDVLVLRGAWLRSAGAHPNSLLHNIPINSVVAIREGQSRIEVGARLQVGKR